MADILSLQNALLSVTGPSGMEEDRAKLIADMIGGFCDEVRVDRMYNVIAHKKGNGPKTMISAHMDTLGFIVTFIEENGSLRFERLGGLTPNVILNTVVRFANGVRGKVSRVRDPLRRDVKTGLLQTQDLYIDIGAGSREEAEKMVSVGDAAVYMGPAVLMGDGMILSPYLDDLISCVSQIMAMERLKGETLPNDVYFVFSVQEELGLRGAKGAAYGIDPAWGVAVDVTPVGDGRGQKRPSETVCGKGVSICSMNGSLIMDPKVVNYIRKIAAGNGISHQDEIMTRGGTDAAAIQHNRTGAAAGGISIPTRYIHSPSEMAALSDIESCTDLLCALLRSDPVKGGLL
ncbi:MAG: M20/M25/M40 family metallo-hydrolase [Lachnospiraceae bacterium]|nr:M20/M25/M40 family metallo-hydrolase [Lachnospiraceae bacterium]